MYRSTERRKKPRCHTCGGPMAGHKRPQGTVVCPSPPVTPKRARVISELPEDSLPSPPHSAGPTSLQRRNAHLDLEEGEEEEAVENELTLQTVIPFTRRWHWKNRYWRSPEPEFRPPVQSAPRAGSPSPSDAPTEPVTDPDAPASIPAGTSSHAVQPVGEDGESFAERLSRLRGSFEEPPIQPFELDANDLSTRSFLSRIEPAIDAALRVTGSVAIAKIFRIKISKLDTIREAVALDDVHMAHVPPGLSSQGDDPNTCWVVLGRDPVQVLEVLNRFQKGMPGAIDIPDAWGSVGFLQLTFAGVVGGLVVTYGLSLL